VILFDVRHPTPKVDCQDDVLRRYRDYRKTLRWAGITCAADALRQPEVAAAVRKRGHCVDVHSCEELAFVVVAGIPAPRIVMHDDGITAAPIRCGVNARVGRFILGCRDQVDVLAACADRPQRVLVDVSTGSDDAIAAVFARPHLDLIGLHAWLAPDAIPTEYADTAARMIAQMADIRREHHVIPTRVSLAGGGVLSDRAAAPNALRRLAAELDDAFDDACARFRFPRPALILAAQ
jgi:diaminopimelate decarboxylase